MTEQQQQRRWLLTASYTSVAVAVTLIVIKTGAWLYTGSASLLGSLLDSLMDSMASIVSMLAVRYSLQPADLEHRFGHGKAESLAALAQSLFILVSGAVLLYHCVERLMNPAVHSVAHATIGIVVMVIAIAMTMGLVMLQSHVIKLTSSAAISADQLHYKGDLFMNLSVIVALGLVQFGYQQADVLLGIGISVYIAIGAVKIAREALSVLMDEQLGQEVDRKVYDLAMAHKCVLGVHDLRTRRSGMTVLIQLHIELPDHLSLLEAHRHSDEVEASIRKAFPGADVIIHPDPACVVPDEQNHTRQIFEVPEQPG